MCGGPELQYKLWGKTHSENTVQKTKQNTTALDIGVMRLKSESGWTSIVLMEGFAEVEENKVTILCNGAEEASTIDRSAAQEELERVTLLVDEEREKLLIWK